MRRLPIVGTPSGRDGFLAPMDLDGQMHDAEFVGQQRPVVLRLPWLMRDDAERGGIDSRSDRPDMQVGESVVGVALDAMPISAFLSS